MAPCETQPWDRPSFPGLWPKPTMRCSAPRVRPGKTTRPRPGCARRAGPPCSKAGHTTQPMLPSAATMSDMASPRDPIFWLHHCNVDRKWARWNAQGRRNTTNQMWATYPFVGMFVSPQGNGTTPFNVRVADVRNHRALGYTYSDLPRTEDFVPGTPEAELPDLRVI